MKARLSLKVALLAGALLTLAFPEPDIWPLAWIAFAPALYLSRGTGPKHGAFVWLAFGVGFFGTLLSWITIVGWVAWGMLMVIQLPFVVAFGVMWGALSGRTGTLGRVALAGGAWAMLEFLRASVPVIGFTWGQLAQSQHNIPMLLSWVGLGGGVMFAGLIVAFNAALAELIERRDTRRAAVVVGMAAVLAGGGAWMWRGPGPDEASEDITVALVQGNVDPLVIHDFDKDLRILTRHVELTEGIDEDVDLVVWPESAAAIDPDTPVVPPLVTRAAQAVAAPMIIGATEDVENEHNQYLVMAHLVAPTGEIIDRYQKTHLVPFGEYVPARDLLDWLPILDQVPRDAIPGEEGNLFDVAGAKVATVLSFEGDFGSLVRQRIAAGGRLLVVATNTSTWRRSWASAQHVAFSQVRAAENGVPVIHAALSGISAVIERDGEVAATLPMYEAGVLIEEVSVPSTISDYARFGEWILLTFIIGCALAWNTSRVRARKVASPDD